MSQTQPKPSLQSKDAEKAAKILELTLELRDMQNKRKAVAGAFTTRIKEIKQDIQDILNDEQTAGQIVESVHDIHDLKVVE